MIANLKKERERPITMARIQKTDDTKCIWDMEQQKLSLIAGINVNGIVILEGSLADTKLNSLTNTISNQVNKVLTKSNLKSMYL